MTADTLVAQSLDELSLNDAPQCEWWRYPDYWTGDFSEEASPCPNVAVTRLALTCPAHGEYYKFTCAPCYEAITEEGWACSDCAKAYDNWRVT